MSDTIDLSTDVHWVTEELGVLVVQGEPTYVSEAAKVAVGTVCGPCRRNEHRYTPIHGWCLIDGCPCCAVNHVPRLVAPRQWAQYDKPCADPLHDTTRLDGGWAKCDRPTCRDGRQVWTVRIPIGRPLADNATPGYEWSAAHERSATVQVVPVVEFADGLKPNVRQVVVKADENACVLWMGDGELFTLPLDQLPVPGRDWAVIVRKVAA